MALLRLNSIHTYFGELQLFKNLSFVVNQGDKVALVANNGTGKSTLINLIMKKDVPFSGDIEIDPDCSIGLLEQSPELNSDATIYDEVFNSHTEIVELLDTYNRAIANNTSDELVKLNERIENLDAWNYETRVQYILSLMKLPEQSTKISILSGGQQKRVALAKLLLQKPDLLILDEPTNHLDIEIIEWLEGFLASSSITLLMVTHDRYFLDRVCNTIVEIANGEAYTYAGNYSYFLEKKQEREFLQQAEVLKAKNLLRSELDWIRRQPKARGTKAKYRVDAFYELQKKAQHKSTDKDVSISVSAKRLGNKVIEIDTVSKAYGATSLFANFSYTFTKSEKIGIIGKNGCGKSTLLRIITGEEQSDTGSVIYGETLEIGYFKQEGLQASSHKRVLEVITDISERITLQKGVELSAAQYLEHWLFPRSMHHLRIYTLSGGERKRLYLMTVLMNRPNFLILDEPTNDLDLSTIHILEEYLQSFDGCVLIVSHDRFFTDKVVDQLFVFDEAGIIKNFPGNYSTYKDYVEFEKEQAHIQTKKQELVTQAPKAEKKKGLIYKERIELENLEQELAVLEQEKEDLQNTLQSGTLSSDELVTVSQKIGELIHRIEQKELRWLELSEKGEG